jgi:hypothetical protein
MLWLVRSDPVEGFEVRYRCVEVVFHAVKLGGASGNGGGIQHCPILA